MTVHRMSLEQLTNDLHASAARTGWAEPGRPNVVVVDASAPAPDVQLSLPPTLAAVVLAVEPPAGELPSWCDAVCQDADAEVIERQVMSTPIAATALVQLLRDAPRRSMTDGLIAESAVYSTLQAGPEFAAWRSSTPRRERHQPDAPVVEVERFDDVLRISLNRPHVRNALSSTMRDALLDALELARLDPSLTVELRGNGPSYSAGGDLDEFGSFANPAAAHLVRLATALGPAIADLGDRLTVTLHGACAGSGIELPAFAQRVVARDDLDVWLPELGLGLIPGAGGTWSLPQRIGRHRTAWLALTGAHLTFDTALQWGLVDGVAAM